MSTNTGVSTVGQSGSSSWTQLYKLLVDFFWIEGDANITDTQLLDISGNGNHVTIIGKDFVTDYIPATSAAKFDCPNNATFIANDTDNLWINKNEESRGVEVSELIGYDFARTIVWYDNDFPHHIRAIAILKSTVTLTQAKIDQMHTDFQLPLFWSGVENVNGFIKANRGLAQNVWTAVTAAALDYSDTYETAVIADGGEIINRKVLESEYQRLIDTGDIDNCWYSYNWQCGIKRATRTYSEVEYSCVTKWYNLSPVAGRFADSVIAYAQAAEPEYTSLGIRFRPVNLDGGVRCGLQSVASVLPNVNATIRARGMVIPLGGLVNIQRKGYASDDGLFAIVDDANRKINITVRNPLGGSDLVVAKSDEVVFINSSETTYELTASDLAITAKANGVDLSMGTGAMAIYPAHNYSDCIGSARDLGRTPYNGYIKQIELFTL